MTFFKSSFWNSFDSTLRKHSEYILTEELRRYVTTEEQIAYEKNLPELKSIIDEFANELKNREFWTEIIANNEGFRFRYSKVGYYGPGGFTSQFHIAGPLVLGVINPKGDPIASFYKNDLDQNVEIGSGYDKEKFISFIKNNVKEYISPENLIITREQYDRLRTLSTD